MAVTEFGLTEMIVTDDSAVPETASLVTKHKRGKTTLKPSAEAAGFKARAPRFALAGIGGFAGAFLLIQPEALAGGDGSKIWLVQALAGYLVAMCFYWVAALLRAPFELVIDYPARAFQLISPTLFGKETCQTIRFEEVAKIELIDSLASVDMRASQMNWELGRIDITWQGRRVAKTLVGDVNELELVIRTMRNAVGMA